MTLLEIHVFGQGECCGPCSLTWIWGPIWDAWKQTRKVLCHLVDCLRMEACGHVAFSWKLYHNCSPSNISLRRPFEFGAAACAGTSCTHGNGLAYPIAWSSPGAIAIKLLPPPPKAVSSLSPGEWHCFTCCGGDKSTERNLWGFPHLRTCFSKEAVSLWQEEKAHCFRAGCIILCRAKSPNGTKMDALEHSLRLLKPPQLKTGICTFLIFSTFLYWRNWVWFAINVENSLWAKLLKVLEKSSILTPTGSIHMYPSPYGLKPLWESIVRN